MSKTYCLNCNHATPWSDGLIPKFCSKCGKPYVSESAAVKIPIFKNQAPQNKKSESEEVFEDDVQPIKFTEAAKNIQFSLNNNLRPQRMTGEQVLADGFINGKDESAVVQKEKPKKIKITKAEKKKQVESAIKEFENTFNRNTRRNRVSSEIED